MNRQSNYWDLLAPRPLDASVIDPNDRLGFKNRYLASLRNREILRALPRRSDESVVLDLGCGTGSLSSALAGEGWHVIGIDISRGLLHRTPERKLGPKALFVHYDGSSIPLRDASVDAITTYVVLNHILDDRNLATVLSECRRVLKPSCRMVCIEQVRRRPYHDWVGWKHQRTLDAFISAFRDTGFRIRSHKVVRYGHFPTTALVRLGVVPPTLFGLIASAERIYGRLRGIALHDYCDVLFELEKFHEDV